MLPALSVSRFNLNETLNEASTKLTGARTGNRLRGVPKPDRQLPIGSTRLQDTGAGIYRLIKTASGEWKYEHRVVMAEKLGRELEPWEHIHHKNHDRLDNSLDNLALTTRYAHPTIHFTIATWSRVSPQCLDCGTTERRHISFGLCSACYQRARAARIGWRPKKT